MTTETAVEAGGHELWVKHARQWQHVASPQRPTTPDHAIMLAHAEPVLAACAAVSRPAEICQFGVTPELARRYPPPGDASAAQGPTIWPPLL